MKKLLAIDAGNSNVKYGLFVNGRLRQIFKHPTRDTADRAAEILAGTDAPVALASVVPEAGRLLRSLSGQRLLLEVNAENQKILTGMDPEMGADRIADAVAAWVLYGKKKQAIVSLSFGTASTLLAVDKAGAVLGGWISSGLSAQLETMHERCALLPLLKMEGGTAVLGTDTDTHMRNGVFVANIGAAREWIAVARSQLDSDAVAVATGGWAGTLQQTGNVFDFVDEALTLKGVYIIAREFGRQTRV